MPSKKKRKGVTPMDAQLKRGVLSICILQLLKEKDRLSKELARVNGMLSNERFVSKAPEAKIQEERAKQEKYTQMMEQVKERLKSLS